MLFGTDSDAHLMGSNQIIDTLRKHSLDETSELKRAMGLDTEILIWGAKLCPFCGGKPTMQPEGDYWEITCSDCGVFKVGSTYDEALDAWNLSRRLDWEE